MKIIQTILYIVIFTAVIIPQKVQTQKYHPLSGTFLITINGGPTLAITDYNTKKIDYEGYLIGEYYIPTYNNSFFGVRAFYEGGFISADDKKKNPDLFRTSLTAFGIGPVYGYSSNDKFFPYITAGLKYFKFYPMNADGMDLTRNIPGDFSKKEFEVFVQSGFKYAITDNFCFDFNAGISISPKDNLDAFVGSANNDSYVHLMAGFSYSFFNERDDDGDGVVNSKDECPNTPYGVKVDEKGCPKDSDKDGVPDYLDQCPNTPSNLKVDAKGCPLDSDGDGVPDGNDLCPGTPAGVKVDEYGCPYDLDGDGVPDYLDKCPNTPPGVQVDEKGCPKDSDNDGVPDYLDKCPDTKQGVKVDKNGCPINLSETNKEPVKEINLTEPVVLAGSNFAFNSAELLPSVYPNLDNIVKEMKKYPLGKWRVEGYTDNVGSDSGNVKISLMRAQSVINYFISKGIVKDMFEAAGLGKINPVADNSTEQGRSKNRRVRIVRIK